MFATPTVQAASFMDDEAQSDGSAVLTRAVQRTSLPACQNIPAMAASTAP
jgi:hypothetical protein